MGGPTAVGSLFKVAGNINQTMTANAASMSNELELQRQSQIKAGQAVDAEARGAVLAGAALEKGTAIAAKQRGAYSDAGVDASVGTAADVSAETAVRAAHEANLVTNNAAREAWGFRESAVSLATQARREKSQRDERTAGAVLSSAASIIGGIGGGFGD